jgi:ABC-type transporter MlaC component
MTRVSNHLKVTLPAILASAIVVTASVSLPALAQDGKVVVQNLVNLMALGHGETQKIGIYSEADKSVDFESMAELSLGAPTWDKLSTMQKTEFVACLKKLIEQRYYPRWHKIFSRGKIAFVGETVASKDTYVKTDLTVGKKQTLLVWRLHPRAGELKIISLSVGPKDLLERASLSFHKHLEKSSFEGLIAWMKDKLDEEDAPGDKTSTTAADLN